MVVVLDDDQRVKGVLGERQLIKAPSEGIDASETQCHNHMEMDFMKVKLTDSLKGVLADVRLRSPQAVIAVDEHDESGLFSPGDYQEAVQLVDNLRIEPVIKRSRHTTAAHTVEPVRRSSVDFVECLARRTRNLGIIWFC